MADERRSDREVAGALGQLIAGVEDAGVAVEEPIESDALLETEQADDPIVEELELEDETDPEDDPVTAFMTLVHEGQEYPKSESEVQTLAQQGLHFTKNMTALAEDRRAWEQQRTEAEQGLMAQHQEYATVLPVLRAQVESAMGPEPDWVTLSQQASPQEFQQIQANWNQQQGKLNATLAEEQRVQGIIAQQQAKQAEEWRTQQHGLTLERIPEWRDETAQTAAKAEIQAYLLELGLTNEQFGQIHDNVFWQVLRDAISGRQARGVGKKEVERLETKAVEPGSGKQKTSRARRRQKQRDRARAGGGKVHDVAPLMAELLTKK